LRSFVHACCCARSLWLLHVVSSSSLRAAVFEELACAAPSQLWPSPTQLHLRSPPKPHPPPHPSPTLRALPIPSLPQPRRIPPCLQPLERPALPHRPALAVTPSSRKTSVPVPPRPS